MSDRRTLIRRKAEEAAELALDTARLILQAADPSTGDLSRGAQTALKTSLSPGVLRVAGLDQAAEQRTLNLVALVLGDQAPRLAEAAQALLVDGGILRRELVARAAAIEVEAEVSGD